MSMTRCHCSGTSDEPGGVSPRILSVSENSAGTVRGKAELLTMDNGDEARSIKVNERIVLATAVPNRLALRNINSKSELPIVLAIID